MECDRRDILTIVVIEDREGGQNRSVGSRSFFRVIALEIAVASQSRDTPSATPKDSAAPNTI